MTSRSGILLLGAWFVVVVALTTRHVVWRDEVRALSLALQGDSVVDMLRGLHGEGHPALWYLLLRGANTLLPPTAVLAIVSVVVALAAMVLLVRRSPFGAGLIALFMLGRPALYEYVVMSRNYGIAMLLMFLFAALYERHRDRGVALGVVLFLLANCNVHSAILAGAFCLFWLLDLLWNRHDLQPGALRNFWLNAVVACMGVALCAATIYPPFNDAAQLDKSNWTVGGLATSLLLPSVGFPNLSGYPLWQAIMKPTGLWHEPYTTILHLALSLMLVGSVLGLATRPAASVAGAAALLGMSIFFSLIYKGSYRHEALLMVFILSLYWISGRSRSIFTPTSVRYRLSRAGFACFVCVLLLQVVSSASRVIPITRGERPEGRSSELVKLISSRPELRDAIIVADPDFLVESIAHYLPNQTYLLRERKFGNIVVFSRNGRLSLSLDEVLADARRLRAETQRPIVILLMERLDPAAPARTVPEGYNWTFSTTPAQVAEFISATRLLASFGPVCCNDETFDVYLLDR